MNKIIQKFGVIGSLKKTLEISHRRGRIWDKKDNCVYSKKDVTNFSRFLFRNHANEDSVRKILELSKRNQKKKPMLQLLRNEGNFRLLEENKLRPVQRFTETFNKNKSDIEKTEHFLPCAFCKGIYIV